MTPYSVEIGQFLTPNAKLEKLYPKKNSSIFSKTILIFQDGFRPSVKFFIPPHTLG